MADYKKIAVDILKASLPIAIGVLGGMLAYDGIKALQMKSRETTPTADGSSERTAIATPTTVDTEIATDVSTVDSDLV